MNEKEEPSKGPGWQDMMREHMLRRFTEKHRKTLEITSKELKLDALDLITYLVTKSIEAIEEIKQMEESEEWEDGTRVIQDKPRKRSKAIEDIKLVKDGKGKLTKMID